MLRRHVGHLGLRELRQVLAEHHDASGGWLIEAGEELDQRGLPAAVLADASDHHARRDLKAAGLERPDGGLSCAECAPEVLSADHRLVSHGSSPALPTWRGWPAISARSAAAGWPGAPCRWRCGECRPRGGARGATCPPGPWWLRSTRPGQAGCPLDWRPPAPARRTVPSPPPQPDHGTRGANTPS